MITIEQLEAGVHSVRIEVPALSVVSTETVARLKAGDPALIRGFGTTADRFYVDLPVRLQASGNQQTTVEGHLRCVLTKPELDALIANAHALAADA